MSGGLDRAALTAGLKAIAARMESRCDELNAADGKLGDGDLGVTMTRGMETVMAEMEQLPADVGLALLACAKCFTKVSGSSFGTLLATGLMAGAKQCKGREQVPWSEISALLGAAREAMQTRGKAELGDKTVLDALASMAEATAGLEQPQEIAKAALEGAQKALDQFRDCENRQGRARMYGEKSKGLDDPGMLAVLHAAAALAEDAT